MITYAAIIPFNNVASGFLSAVYFPELDTQTSSKLSGKLMGIPFLISAIMTPILGTILDKKGNRV